MADLERPDLYVVARFLERLWRDQRVYRKTDLQLAVRLNYRVYKKYLDWMISKDLIAVSRDAEGVERIAMTPKGMRTYDAFVGTLREFVGDERF
ncbi:MAG TPA: winged helix-turn-helix domain-containing protein [Candidatus Thermoplasmatota archaeon]|jgi:predicted transcriptional regulator|nr:winged helix-turn-helix domain-containing protein [Candidatus Thermoplasmatota archaeon]